MFTNNKKGVINKVTEKAAIDFNEMVIVNGFENIIEFHKLISSVDLSTVENIVEFKKWQTDDGTKKGLLVILNKKGNIIK